LGVPRGWKKKITSKVMGTETSRRAPRAMHHPSITFWICFMAGKRFFDAEKCADGIQALRHYRYEVEEAKSNPTSGHIALSKVPRHDWASHGADAFRTEAVMIREPEKKKEQEKRRPAGKLSPWS
jgi:hypothetical protein